MLTRLFEAPILRYYSWLTLLLNGLTSSLGFAANALPPGPKYLLILLARLSDSPALR